MVKKLDLLGLKFGRLFVDSASKSDASGKAMWNCICECGNKTVVASGSLKSGNSKSCGCLKIELTKKLMTTHGLSNTPEFFIWCDMNKRCSENNNNKADYFDRGISVSEELKNDFVAFLNEVGKRPNNKYSLGRIDNNEGYKIGNIRWEVAETQARNHTKQRNNQSGITGVYLRKERTGIAKESWVAQVNLLSGKVKQKSFSVVKYGEEAKTKAIDWRNYMINELNLSGAGYAKSHGDDK